MKTFLVRAQKEKKKKKKILSRLGLGNEEMGFVKIQVKRAKLKRNGKSLFPRSTSSPFARVNHRPEMFIDEPFLIPNETRW